VPKKMCPQKPLAPLTLIELLPLAALELSRVIVPALIAVRRIGRPCDLVPSAFETSETWAGEKGKKARARRAVWRSIVAD
jgi:hypothetical protein